MQNKLFIPGPINVREDVLEKMSTQQIGHRTEEASKLQKSVTEKLKKVFQTESSILLSTSSGTGLMEGSVRSCTKNKVAVFSCGAFGDKFYKICKSNGIEADLFKVPLGEAITKDFVDKCLKNKDYDVATFQHNETSTGITNPIEEISDIMNSKYSNITFIVDAISSLGGVNIPVDKLNIDICITSTQKCLGLPAGFSCLSINDKTIEKARSVENRGTYFDLVAIYDKDKSKNQYPSTPSLSHMFALDYQLDRILEETIEKRFLRHEEMANIVRNFAKRNFELFVNNEKYLSNTITCIKNTKNINMSLLNKELAKNGYIISNGYGDLKDKTFRISHMADYTVDDVNALIDEFEEILNTGDIYV